MKPIVTGMIAAVFALTLVMAVAAPAQAQTQTTTFPITRAEFNTCTGDLVIINGTETVTTNITVNRGVFRVQISDRIRGTGVSATGARYTFTSTSRDQFLTSQGITHTVQDTRLVLNRVDGPGPDDLVVIARTTFLVNNQTGEVVRESQEFNARCR
jgi:hypothetical protein